MTTTETKKRTITMTGRAPVTIRVEDWPVIAQASDSAHDGEIECQANRTWNAWAKVRRHADGRTLVYGRADYDSQYRGERGVMVREGYLLPPGADPVDVALAMCSALVEAIGRDWDLGADLIASMPAEEI